MDTEIAADNVTDSTASQRYNQLIRIVRIAVVVSCAAGIAALVGWAPSSISGASDNATPDRLSAAPAQAAGTTETATDQAQRSSDTPTRPTCAERGVIASTPEIGATDESVAVVGCGVRSNLAEGTPASSEERVDVATLLAWHVQAYNLIQYAYQTTLSGSPQTDAKYDGLRRR
jgi:hypothetical protein